MADVQLGAHLPLSVFEATRHVELAGQNHIPAELIENARAVGHLLDRIIDRIGPVTVSSGYRCPALNAAVGGAKSSAHLQARAVDFLPHRQNVRDSLISLVKSDIAYDKAIVETAGGHVWLHTQVSKPGSVPRRETLMCLAPGIFEQWNPWDPRVLTALA